MQDSTQKIIDINELSDIVVQAKKAGRKIAQCHGVFDLLHPGHIRYFEAARKVSDLLVVTLVPDKYVNKGPGRPVYNQRLRAESIAALQSVDYVSLTDSPNVRDTILKVRPDLFVKGRSNGQDVDEEIFPGEADEEEAIRTIGGRIYFVDEIGYSSTNLLNNYFDVFSPEADKYLRHFRRHHTAGQVINQLKNLSSLSVLVIGDIIFDEYHYCKAVGKSSKSPTLTAKFISAERFAGGVLAVANHAAGFSRKVHLLTYLGDPESDEEFICGHILPNVTPHLIKQSGRPNTVKRRYVDPFQISKIFEIMWIGGNEPLLEAENDLIKKLENLLPQVDLVIVADFGHGCLGKRTIECLGSWPIFMAVNAQTNSANFGYNMVTKYPRADYFCIDEEEIRLASQDQSSDLEEIMSFTASKMKSKMATVTRGAKGSTVWKQDGTVASTPVFSSKVVDSVGAGDAFLSVTSLCAKMDITPELLGFIGNCTGALAVRIIGNEKSVGPGPLYQFISTLLK